MTFLWLLFLSSRCSYRHWMLSPSFVNMHMELLPSYAPDASKLWKKCCWACPSLKDTPRCFVENRMKCWHNDNMACLWREPPQPPMTIILLFCKYIGQFKIQVSFYKGLTTILCQWPDMLWRTLKPSYQSRGHETCAWVVKMGPCDFAFDLTVMRLDSFETWPLWGWSLSWDFSWEAKDESDSKGYDKESLKALFVWFAADAYRGKHCISINSVRFSLSGLRSRPQIRRELPQSSSRRSDAHQLACC